MATDKENSSQKQHQQNGTKKKNNRPKRKQPHELFSLRRIAKQKLGKWNGVL